MGWNPFARRRPAGPAALRREDIDFLSPVQAAREVEPATTAVWAIYLMLAALVVAVTWSALSEVDMVVRAEARVIPVGREQLIASLEGGILRELKVREGETVEAGQPLALLDPTRVEAQQAESRAKRIALLATVARLQAEAGGRPLKFPAEVLASPAVVRGETDSFNARARALSEAVGVNSRNARLLEHELKVAEGLSAKGLMSEVEVMRIRRQVNDLSLSTQERVNRFRQDASAELVKLQTELSMLDEQLVVRDDMLRRTTLTSPVRGVVKNIRNNTVGGVVAGGAPVMEIVPLGDKVLVEVRVKPANIGFVRKGQEVMVKLTAYEFAVYGGMLGHIDTLSPDALGDAERGGSGTSDATYYRALVQADADSLNRGGRKLAVLPGMNGTAEIRTGKRSVLSYILRPMLKAQEAFKER